MQLQVRDVYKAFGEKSVLEGINLDASGGQALGILGRNGAGKTTTIRIIMGVFHADSGAVLLDGRPLDRDKVQIGYMPEEHGLYPKIKISEQLIYLAALRGVKKAQASATIKKWLERLEIPQYENSLLETLSKGNQQKIQLVACLVANPDFVILDEPFSGLDPVNASILKEVVKELIASGRIVLFSSHQMNYVEEFCDNIAILNSGRIVLSGSLTEIKRSYERNILAVGTTMPGAVSRFCRNELSELVTDVCERRGVLYITMKSADLKTRLMNALSAGALDIDSIGVHEPTLGEIFVEYTGGSAEDEQGQEVKA